MAGVRGLVLFRRCVRPELSSARGETRTVSAACFPVPSPRPALLLPSTGLDPLVDFLAFVFLLLHFEENNNQNYYQNYDP